MAGGSSGRIARERLAGGKHALGIDHLRTSQLKLLLSAAGLCTEGSRDVLLNRLREQVIVDVDQEWVVHGLHTDTPIRADASVVEKSGELYMFGGKEESSDIGSQELLQLPRVGTTWHVVENLGTWPERRYAHCAAVYDNKMYIWGGQRDCNSERYFNDMHCFDFKTHVWREVKQHGSIPEPRSYAKAVVWGKHMLMYGGVDAERGGAGGLTEFSEGAGTVMQFDFETKTWTQHKAHGPNSTKPLPIFIEALSIYKDHLYAITYDYSKPDQHLQVHKLDLDKMKWHKVKAKGASPSSRTRIATVVLGRQWIVHGGLQQSPTEEHVVDPENDIHNTPTDECYAFSFEEEAWEQIEFVGRCPLPRGGHAGCELNGSMVLVGGHVPQENQPDDESVDSDASDGESGFSDNESNESGYTVDSDAGGDDDAEDEEGHAGHAAEQSENESADSASSEQQEISGSRGGSRSESAPEGDAACLKMVEVLQPRPTGPAADRLANIDLLSQLKRFCCSERHSDVALVVDHKRFPAHRLVLAAQSEIFDAMFNGGMKEDVTGEVIVEDMRPEVMRSFMSYLYGCLPSIRPDQAMDLFRASDRYGVHSLRTECLHMLQSAIDAENAAAIAQLADEHQCDDLMNACIRFTANILDLPRVIGSPAYMCLMRGNPELAQKFIQRAAELQSDNGRSSEGGSHRRRRKRRRVAT